MDSYSTYLHSSERQYTLRTIRFYLKVQHDLHASYEERYHCPLIFDDRHFRRAINHYLSDIMSKTQVSTQNYYRSAINNYLNYLRLYANKNISIRLSFAKNVKLPVFVSLNTIFQIKLYLKNSSTSAELKSALALIINHGLSIKEVLQLQSADFNHRTGTAWVGDYKHRREIPLAEETIDYLIDYWLTEYDSTATYFFSHLNNVKILKQCQLISQIVKQRVTPRILKNTLIKQCLENNENYISIMMYFGYASCHSILRYESINVKRLQTEYQIFNILHGRQGGMNNDRQRENLLSINTQSTKFRGMDGIHQTIGL